MIILPNKCYASELQVHPLNWKTTGASLKEKWYIHYRFHDPVFKDDPKFKYGFLRKIKGMNTLKTLEERRSFARGFIDKETKKLKQGFNPITKKSFSPLAFTFELFPQTPFIKSLWLAVEKLSISHNYKIGVKCVIRGVEKAAIALRIEQTPVSEITRRYIKVILEKCGELNPKWSARQYNYYRTALMSLFRELIQSEALESNPVKEIPKRAEIKKVRETLTKEQRILVSNFLHEKYYNFWRFVQIFYASGAREAEIINVRVKDVDLIKQTFRVIIKKGRSVREVEKAINNDIVHLWKELINDCPKDFYIFSIGLIPGEKLIRYEQLTRRWRVHVKKKLGITSDLYATKHLRTTNISEKMGTKTASEMNSHTSEAMVRSIYDTGYTNRNLERLKNINDSFAG